MTSYNRLVENYERREKELNASLVAFYLQSGHLILSGKTDLKDDEYSRSYELIAAQISSINDQCREISANEQRKNELEKSVQTLKKTIQDFEPEKRSRYIELGKYLFANYTQHLSSTFGTVYSALSEEKKYTDALEKSIAEITIQLEKKDFFSKILLKVKQSSLNTQLSAKQHKIESLLAEGAEKAFRAGAVTTENGGTAYSACRILQDEIASVNAKLEDTVAEITRVSEKLKETDKKSRLLAAAADKAGELDKIAESAGIKLVSKYVSADAKPLDDFPESYARILSDVVETRRELCSIARRKEMLRCSEQIENAAASISVMQKELDTNKADIERLTKRNEELSERIASAVAAADSIKQRKIALEVEEGVSVNRLLGVVTESANTTSAENASTTSFAAESATTTSTEYESNVAPTSFAATSPAGSVETSVTAADVADSDATSSATGVAATEGNAIAGEGATGADGTSEVRDSDSPAADVAFDANAPAEPAVTATVTADNATVVANDSGKPVTNDAGTPAEPPKPKRTYKKRAPKTAESADGEKTSSDSKAADSAGKKGKGDKQPKSASNTAAKKVKNDKAADKTKNTKTNEEVSTST